MHGDTAHPGPVTGLRAHDPNRSSPAFNHDVALLFAARAVRMFGYGFLAVVLVLYLSALGLSGSAIGVLLALTLLGDVVVSLWLTTHADRLGRRRVLTIGAILMLAAGLAFAATPVYAVLLAAATVGVISPSGNEVGPFLAVEQASLSQLVGDRRRTTVFARYQLVGSFATAGGALAAGALAQVAIQSGASATEAYRLVIVGYAMVGAILAALFSRVSPGGRWPRRRLPWRQSAHAWVCIGRRAWCCACPPCSRSTPSPAASWSRASSPSGSSSASAVDPGSWAGCCSGRTSWPGSRRWPPAGWRRGSAWCDTMVFTPPAVERAAALGAVDAERARSAVGDAPGALQHQPDGRADTPVVHDGGRRTRTNARRPPA